MMMTKEQMFEAEMVHQQLEQLQNNLGTIEKQMMDVHAMKEAILAFNTIEGDEEMLVPLAAGVFMRATATSDKLLRVNVGQGVIVEKTAAQVQEMLDEQLNEMRKYEDHMHGQFDQLLAKLQRIEEEFKKA